MYLCLDCGYIFSNPKTYTETHGLDTPPYEKYLACPVCGGAFVETYPCAICDNWITGDYIELSNGDIICDDCYVCKHIED